MVGGGKSARSGPMVPLTQRLDLEGVPQVHTNHHGSVHPPLVLHMGGMYWWHVGI